jgi:hypothetical protein
LPAVRAVGFTGHRHLPDEALARQAIREFLTSEKDRAGAVLYGVSSAAAGGDLLFAESCLELGLPLRILLPMPQQQWRSDFDEASWSRVENVLGQALSVEITGSAWNQAPVDEVRQLSGGAESEPQAVENTREQLYFECGMQTVLESEILLALWDGEPSRGLGGTAEIVAFAEQQHHAVVWIHSRSGVVERRNQNPQALANPELEFLNSLPDPSGAPAARTPNELARAWFRKLDENASRAAPQFRRLAAIPILCTATAAVSSGLASIAGGSAIWLGVGSALGAMVAVLPAALRLSRRQSFWVRVRTAAEICRSHLALWLVPGRYAVIGAEVLPELSGMLRSLEYLKLVDRTAGRASLEDFKQNYLEERVRSQISYFQKHATSAGRQAALFHGAFAVATSLAVAVTAWIFVSSTWLTQFSPGPWKIWFSLGATICFQLAAVVGALVVVQDSDRRRGRYREMYSLLQTWEKQLAATRTWSSALGVATRVERALLTEIIEWRANRKR